MKRNKQQLHLRCAIVIALILLIVTRLARDIIFISHRRAVSNVICAQTRNIIARSARMRTARSTKIITRPRPQRQRAPYGSLARTRVGIHACNQTTAHLDALFIGCVNMFFSL